MSRSACRKFSLLDAMILVAATGVGLALTRGLGNGWPVVLGRIREVGESGFAFTQLGLGRLLELLYVLIPCATLWTLALLVLRLRHPRPTLRHLVRQPGTVACCVTTLVVAIDAACVAIAFLLTWVEWGGPSPMFGLWRITYFIPIHVGYSVAGSWLMLALTRRWRPEAGWIDRAGRILGIGWIGLGPGLAWFVYLPFL